MSATNTTSRLTCDVLVVGLGPAGAMAAKSAAQAGARVIAIDRRAEAGVPVQCAEFVPALVGQSTQHLAAARTQDITGMVTYLPDARDTQATFRGTMIDRRAFDAGLVREASASGADCRFGVSLRTVRADGTAELSPQVFVHAAVIIGTDGPRSRVGAVVGRCNHEIAETRQITVPLTQLFKTTDIYLSPDILGGYAWLFPRGDVANLGIGVDQSARATLKPLLDRLRAQLIADGRIGTEILGHTGGAIPVGGMLNPVAYLDRVAVLLAGDAAGLANPITGAGIAAAVQSGALAGAAAAHLAHGNATAARDFADDMDDLFASSIGRAVSRRQDLLDIAAARAPTMGDLKRAWIAFPDYWAVRGMAAATQEHAHVLS
jgi:digeranylgeranylglycerophospholipid reductase